MSSAIVTVENLGKRYRLGAHSNERYTALRDVITNKTRSVFRRPRSALRNSSEADASEFWALKNVNFEVKQGEVLGIIGRNGAGKSTLLKILSRITEPTEGRIKIKGRVASLLEVGTGFHPELTGRENIFLNGAILGMHRHEIKSKFDEIVAFAEVERFLDTPVKRYSSGMYVRLAFSVAAHLEADILIIDEVLAVGDAQFQRKCFAKVEAITSQSARTILIVSHQMGVVSRLCRRGVLLEQGAIAFSGSANDAVGRYLAASRPSTNKYKSDAPFPAKKSAVIREASTTDEAGHPQVHFAHTEKFCIEVNVQLLDPYPGLRLGVGLQDRMEMRVTTWVHELAVLDAGSHKEVCSVLTIDGGLIAPNEYTFIIALFVPGGEVVDYVERVCQIRIYDDGTELAQFEGAEYGSVIIPAQWTTRDLSRSALT